MTEVAIIIPGKPIAKARPRFVQRGKFHVAYNPQETEEGRWVLTAREQIGGVRLEGALTIVVTFHMPIPKGTSKKHRLFMLENKIKHTKKPDLDNLVKFVKDCLNGELWRDDSQVVLLWAAKRYGLEPCTEVQVRELSDVLE